MHLYLILFGAGIVGLVILVLAGIFVRSRKALILWGVIGALCLTLESFMLFGLQLLGAWITGPLLEAYPPTRTYSPTWIDVMFVASLAVYFVFGPRRLKSSVAQAQR